MKIPMDKVSHFIAGYGIALTCIGLTLKFMPSMPLGMSWLAAFSVTFIFATGKEVYDYLDYGKADSWDIMATMGGGVLGCAMGSILWVNF